MNSEEIQITLNEYLDIIYDYTLINSLIFASDIEKFIYENIKIDKLDQSKLLYLLNQYLLVNKDNNIFDNQNKENLYFLINYFSERDYKIDKLEKNSLINNMKIIVNNLETDNFEFLKNQILLRDYGTFNYHFNKFIIDKIPEQTIIDCKECYYNSISNDFLVMNLLLKDESKFYTEDYKLYLLLKDFYRSVNYFAATYEIFFKKLDWLKRIKFIMEKDLNILMEATSKDEMAEVDEEFFDIATVTQKWVKKFGRKVK